MGRLSTTECTYLPTSKCCFACALPLASWLLLSGVHARCAICALSLATWLLITGSSAWCVV